jgi:hypothetical protein
LEAQQHKKYAQTTPLDDGVSSLFPFQFINFISNIKLSDFENVENLVKKEKKSFQNHFTSHRLQFVHLFIRRTKTVAY